MPLRNTPLAIDGGRIDSATLRIEAFANASGNEGVINRDDLKVAPLDVPGAGVKVGHGAAIVLNRYQTATGIDQSYVVSNLGEAILDSSYMPAASAARSYHILAVTIADPEFTNVNHPWFVPPVPTGEEETFQYVRFHVIQNVPNTAIASHQAAIDYLDANVSYPAYPLAGLDIPANTATITSAEIKDLRALANPKVRERIEHIPAPGTNSLQGAGGVAGTWEDWPSAVSYDLYIPRWATRAQITGFLEGARHTKAGWGQIRVTIDDVGSTELTNINESAPTSGNNDRKSYNVGGSLSIPAAARGTTKRVRLQGKPGDAASQGFLTTDANSSGSIRVRLEEEAI